MQKEEELEVGPPVAEAIQQAAAEGAAAAATEAGLADGEIPVASPAETRTGTASKAFQRVKADDWLGKKGARDNSYKATFGSNGWGAKAEAVLGQVRKHTLELPHLKAHSYVYQHAAFFFCTLGYFFPYRSRSSQIGANCNRLSCVSHGGASQMTVVQDHMLVMRCLFLPSGQERAIRGVQHVFVTNTPMI